MASRWAFETFMVTQFRDNPYEQQFYELDKTIAVSDYKRVYHIPELESHLALCLNNSSHWLNPNHAQLTKSLILLRNEIAYELEIVGEDNFPDIKKLAIGKFDSTVYDNSVKFLSTLKQYYLIRQNRAMDMKEKMIAAFTSTPSRKKYFDELREKYENKAVATAVKNIITPNRIVEYNGRLYQRMYPIYLDTHKPSNYFDFSANLFQPTKHFAGNVYNTYYFNLAVMWCMTLFLYITLYFDLLRKFIQLFEQRKQRRRD
jgi:hypothetical protein